MRHRGIAVAMLAALLCQGCVAPLALTLLGVGAGVAAGTGTQYTLDGIAYRTFSEPSGRVREATLATLRRMDVAVATDEAIDNVRSIEGKAGDRIVYVELAPLTTRATRMRVTVKQGWFFRDRATAGEIIAQTEHALDEMPAVPRKRVAALKFTEAAK